MKNDLNSKAEITTLVNRFYSTALKDPLIGPPLSHINFEKHMPVMAQFWCFILLDEPGYTSNVTEKHLSMPLKKEMFDRWVSIFKEVVDSGWTGEKAEMAKQRATVMGWTMSAKFPQE